MTINIKTPFADLERHHYKALLIDPPWRFEIWSGETAVRARASGNGTNVAAGHHYQTMSPRELEDLPVRDIAARNAVLFLWITWPVLKQALDLIETWGFVYKTCGFAWMKANVRQIDMFRDDADASMGMGYWTRANSEVCLLATRGKPKRLHADVRQGIIEPRREHSRKPDCLHERIERLTAGPYIELFSRSSRQGWSSWGHEVGKFDKKGVA